MIDALIADDERPALDELEHLLRADERIGEIVRASSGAEAIRALSERAVDVAFLDIHMPGLSGLDLARAIGQFATPPAIVFVTADEARALEAFEVRAVDYLLKPLRAERLRRAVDRVAQSPAGSSAGSSAMPAGASVFPASDSIVRSGASGPAGTSGSGPSGADRVSGGGRVSVGGGVSGADDETLPAQVGSTIRLVRRGDVRWVQAQGDYSRLHTRDGSHLVRVPISELEERWAESGFVRVHRSYLVRAAAVTALRLSGAEPNVTIGDVVLPVSRRLVASVRETLVPGRGGDSRGGDGRGGDGRGGDPRGDGVRGGDGRGADGGASR